MLVTRPLFWLPKITFWLLKKINQLCVCTHNSLSRFSADKLTQGVAIMIAKQPELTGVVEAGVLIQMARR